MLTTRRGLCAAACAATLVLAGCGGSSGGGGPSATGSAFSPTPVRPSHTSSAPSPGKKKTKPAKTKPAKTGAQIRAEVVSATRAIIKGRPAGGVSVAALNTSTGAHLAMGAHGGMWTASTYKLLMLVTLMLRTGGTGGMDGTAERAIENSDNVAGYSLFEAAGGISGVQGALDRLGMGHTVPGSSDPTFTRTSAMDYLILLEALVRNGPLSAAQRNYAIGLMQQVESDQRWGVGVVADKDDHFANKNGWLSIDNNGPGESDDGLWAVNSVGIMKVHGQQVLMAIFTEHDSDYVSGVRLVQKLARTIVAAVRSS